MMSAHPLCHDLSHSGKFWRFPLCFADAVEFMAQYYQALPEQLCQQIRVGVQQQSTNCI